MTWSAETYRLLGIAPRAAPIPYDDFLKLIATADRPGFDEALRHAVHAGYELELDHRIVLNDGRARWVHTIVRPVPGDRHAPVPGTMMDITEQKHSREALRESAQQLQALSRRLVDIQELERRQFSRELHDRIGQNMTALGINLDILRTGLLNHADPKLRSRLDDSAALLESTTGAIENVISELRPPMLDDYGLLPALQWYQTEFSNRTGIHVGVRGDDPSERLAPEAEIALFRIAQEALNNIVKHAQAKNIEIRLSHRYTECVMTIADDGRGFDVASSDNTRRRSGLGMVTMRERTAAIGGHFEVASTPGKGTRITVRIPS
jgi:two-component system sensor histidine kinase UhpB